MTERENRVSPLTLTGDGILLVCALAGLTGSFLTLYGDRQAGKYASYRATALDLCAARWDTFLLLSALFALLALAAWSLPRFRSAAAGGLTGLVAVAVALDLERVIQGAGLTVQIITGIFSRRVSWGWSFQYDPGLTPSGERAAVQLFLILALALLALVLGWAVVRARRWWVVFAFTLPPLLPGLLADLYPDWLPFMALAACWCSMLLTDLCKWAAPDRRGRLTLTVLPCVAAVLAVITLAFPREGYTRPDWTLDFESELRRGAQRLSDFFSQFDGPFRSTVTYVGAAEEADLTQAGPLNFTGRTVLRVTSDYDGRLYLRGSSLAAYEDGVWKAMTDEVFQEAVRDVPPRVLFFPAMSAEHGPEHTVTVDNVGAVGACVYTPYFLTVQDLEENGMSMVNDSLLARRQGWWSHTLSFVELPEPHPSAQTGVGTVQFTTGQEVSADFGWYSNFVYNHYLDVPEELREELAGQYWTNYGYIYIGNDPLAVAQNIAVLLDQLYEYDQSVGAPPEGVDPVSYFLSDSQRGYCMHFASTATLMLRSLGFPARYVSGFTVESVPGRQMAVPDRAAHAWVEVWVPNFGWYPVEVTPAAAFAWYEQGVEIPVDLPSDPLPESEEPDPTPTPTQQAAPSADPSLAPQGEEAVSPAEGSDLTALLTALKVPAAVLGIAALVWLGQFLPKRYRARRLKSPDRNRAVLDGYGYLLRMKRWDGRVDQRAVELAQKAKFSQHTLTEEERGELRALVDRERGRLCIVLGPVERLVFRYLWGKPASPKKRRNRKNSRENGG